MQKAQITGDFPGEAQLFYEHYCAGCKEISVPNAMLKTQFYFNDKNGVGLLITGSGKTSAGLSLMSLLSWDAYDFSNAIIVSVGCGGGSTGSRIPGDLTVVTAACDLELGHHTDAHELADPDAKHTWFHDDDYDDYSCKRLNSELCEKAYALIQDVPLRTTAICKQALAENFPSQDWALRDPNVSKGTALSADSYWKGAEDHENAVFVVDYYQCPDPYAVTEMEEIAVMNAAECFGLQNRVVSLRVVVNMDTFLKGETPESLWLEGSDFDSKVKQENSETLDIFEPGMDNLFDAGQIVIDAALAGELG
ncbi:MAG: hypothetical protein Q4A01_08055 [Coriobacteriales bacterium]|nr:hypothetical protein [Coriobacteriales bacterium]